MHSAALPGRTYPELIVRMAAGERIEPHVGQFHAGLHFTRYYEQLELDAEMKPTGRAMPGEAKGLAAVPPTLRQR